MSLRTLHAALLVGALAAAVLVTRRTLHHPPTPAFSPLSVVPPGPTFVLSVNVDRVRRSVAGSALSRRMLGELGATTSGCRFDPLRDLEEVVVALAADVPETSVAEGAALIGKGTFSAKDVAACAEERIRSRGGEPSRTTIGSFVSVRDQEAKGELAARDGLFALGEGPYLRELLDAAEGHRPNGSEEQRLRDRLHAELRQRFGRDAPIIATLTVPPGFLERAFGPDAAASPLATVRLAALRAKLEGGIVLGAYLGSGSEAGAVAVERFLHDAHHLVEPLLGDAASRLVKSAITERDREHVEVTMRIPESDAAALLDALARETTP